MQIIPLTYTHTNEILLNIQQINMQNIFHNTFRIHIHIENFKYPINCYINYPIMNCFSVKKVF